MASSAAFPPPHSCDFCQRLVLYKRDPKWWRNALETSRGPEESVEENVRESGKVHIEGLLSLRARKWILTQMRSESNDEATYSLSDFAVFDCTLGEARVAAKEGCTFCFAITNTASPVYSFRADEEAFLAASLSDARVGVLRNEGKTAAHGTNHEGKDDLFQIPYHSVSFEILAELGKSTCI
jgi:hypothetical protein